MRAAIKISVTLRKVKTAHHTSTGSFAVVSILPIGDLLCCICEISLKSGGVISENDGRATANGGKYVPISPIGE